MLKKRIFLIVFAVIVFAVSNALPQTSATKAAPQTGAEMSVRSSPAYAELLLRKTDLESELESLLLDYTEDYPRVKEIRFSLGLLDRDLKNLLAAKQAETGKLTLALGKMMVRRAELETELWKLLQTYKDEHPDVKRAKKRVEIYEKAIKEILG